MRAYKEHLIGREEKVIAALARLDKLAADAILFVVDDDDRLIGSLTDGDVRRGLLRGLTVEDKVTEFIQADPKYINKLDYDIRHIISFRENHFKIIPVVDGANRIVNIVNFRFLKSYLPIDAVVMAGGRGERLRPLTDDTPKPLLKIAGKPIIEHNIDRLIGFGIDDFWISVNYLGDQIKNYFADGSIKNVSIKYVDEDIPLGTIGAVGKVDQFKHETVLVANSDLLTNLDYEDFYLSFIESGADFSVLTIPYEVKVPYAILETVNGQIVDFHEKPTYTYYSNGGIYLMKTEVLQMLPKNIHYNATDLMETLIKSGRKVHAYPLRGYWLDIGRPEEYKKAQEDIKHIKF